MFSITATCDTDQHLCGDGFTFVSRDPNNDCNFATDECPDITCDNVFEECPFAEGDCFVDMCEVNDCPYPDQHPICVSSYCGGCHTVCCPLDFCRDDTKVCNDGTVLTRDPHDECEFPTCPGECPKEIYTLCPDGYNMLFPEYPDCSYPPHSLCPEVYRPTCKNMDDCPSNIPIFDNCIGIPCDHDYMCEDSSPYATCHNSYCGGCFALCCLDCPEDTMLCSDNITVVGRDPDRNCEFEVCPGGAQYCNDDTKLCPDGVTYVDRDPNNNCEFKPCETSRPSCREFFKMLSGILTDPGSARKLLSPVNFLREMDHNAMEDKLASESDTK